MNSSRLKVQLGENWTRKREMTQGKIRDCEPRLTLAGKALKGKPRPPKRQSQRNKAKNPESRGEGVELGTGGVDPVPGKATNRGKSKVVLKRKNNNRNFTNTRHRSVHN